MNFLGGLIKNKIEKIYKATPNEGEDNNSSSRLDFEDTQHTLNVLQEENKILKSKVRILENSIFDDKSNPSQNKSTSSSQFGKIFKEIKSTILYNIEDEPRDDLHDFKKFLYDNMLLHGSIDEDEAEIVNNLQILDSDWDKKKEVYLFKQRVLEKNYTEMFKNILVSNELNLYLKSKGVIIDKNLIDNKKEISRECKKETVDKYDNYDKFDKYMSVSNEKYESNNSKIETKENLSDHSTRDVKIISNKIISPVNKPSDRDKPYLDIENKLLSDLIIVHGKDEDYLSKTPFADNRPPTSSNSNKITNTNDQVTPTETVTFKSSRKSILPQTSNERLKDDFDIASLLSDNNLATSINIIDIKDMNRIEHKIDDGFKIKPEASDLNLVNSNNGHTSMKTTAIPNGFSLSQKSKSEVKNSLLQFDMDEEDSFNFGAIIKTEDDTEKAMTTNTKQIFNKASISNKKENENSFKENIFEQLLNPESSKSHTNFKTSNVKKSQWDDEDDCGDSYV